MTTPHEQLAQFIAERVGLPERQSHHYRLHVNSLKDRLRLHLAEFPAFPIAKVVLVGSVANQTALRSTVSIDVVAYVHAGDAPAQHRDLMPWLAEQFQEVDPNIDPNQLVVHDHGLTLHFRGCPEHFEISPLFYGRNSNDYGIFVRRETGQRLLTSVSRHVEFLDARRRTHGPGFTHLIQLTKWWALLQRTEDPEFRLDSFAIDLIWAHLVDHGLSVEDYRDGLEGFFAWVTRTGLHEQVVALDFQEADRVPERSGLPVVILDPANLTNNVASSLTDDDRSRIVAAAARTLDVLCESRYAAAEPDVTASWQETFGSTFGVTL